LHQEVYDVSSVVFPDQTFAFRSDSDGGVVEVSGGSGQGYLVQGTETGQSTLEIRNGKQVNPAGPEASKEELRTWYQNNHDPDSETTGDIWNMYPKDADIPAQAEYNLRHPGEAHELTN
jgi:hypothetical protein